MACVQCGLVLIAGSVRDTADLPQVLSSSVISWKNQASYGSPSVPSSLHGPLCRNPLPISSSASSSSAAVSSTEAPFQPRKKKLGPRQLFSLATPFNEITVLDIPRDSSSDFAGSRLLLLDESGNVHSIYKEDCKYTNAYWDQFATLPPIIPEGPIAILGLGGGTTARLMLDLWPSCKLVGWEIDEALVEVARDYFGLSELEAPTSHGGTLEVRLDDALDPSATVEGGFAGIVVDLFANGEVLPQLQEPETWVELKKRLKEGGRIMINCGGICVERSDSMSELDDGTWTWEDGGYAKEATLRAMAQVFPETLFRKMGGESDNYMALTGPLPDLAAWAATLPAELQTGLTDWRSFYP